MSELNASNLRKEHGNEGPDLVGTTELTSPYYMVPPSGNTAERPQNPEKGTLRFNTDIGSLEYYKGDTIGWESINRTTPNLDGGARALFMGGYAPGNVDTVDYVTIPTLGNAIDFGNLSTTRRGGAGTSSRVRALMCAGHGTGSDPSNRIDYHEISSLGDFIDFGDMQSGRENSSACSTNTRGIIWGGGNPSRLDTIDYVTIASPGNGQDFGNLVSAKGTGASFSSSTRGLLVGGQGPASPYNVNTIDYIEIATLGNAQDFGDQTTTGASRGGGNSTRGIVAVDGPAAQDMEYLTIATQGNTIDFGDLPINHGGSQMNGNSSSPTRLLIASGATPTILDAISYVEIATTGNGIDFGDLSQARYYGGACSNAHGGL